MSRRREATDLARALALSTQPTVPSSSVSHRAQDSSPPTTPLPTNYMPQKTDPRNTGAGGFMEQYHQQLQQAQSYYQQNPHILAPPSHSSAVRRDNGPRPEKPTPQTSYGLSHRPSVTSSKSSTTHVSDSNRSIPGAISLPDSGYHYPVHRDLPINTSLTLNPAAQRSAQGHPTSSSDIRSSLSGDRATHLGIPLAQRQRSPPQSTISSSAPSDRITGKAVKTPQTISTGSSIRPASTTSHQSSVINTAKGITPVSSDSRIASSSSSFAPTSALEPTFKTTAKGTAAPLPQISVPIKKPNGVATMTATTGDIVADSEGEDDTGSIVPGTLDDSITAAKPKSSEADVVGLRKSSVKRGIAIADSSGIL